MIKKSAILFVHEPAEGGGLFEEILRGRGFEIQSIFTPTIDLKNFDPFGPDLLMIMGGPMGVYELDEHTYLAHEIEVIKARISLDLPTIGICLGAQLMAAAMGTKVYKGPQGPEFGWYGLNLSPGVNDHPARHLTSGVVFQSHADTFDLPVNARLIASSAQYLNQIFSIGNNALGVQCHPEVTFAGLKDWNIPPSEWNLNIDINDFWQKTEINMPDYNDRAQKFFNEWLDRVC
jgi:GMP synthase (glutamine-hydrolysing)